MQKIYRKTKLVLFAGGFWLVGAIALIPQYLAIRSVAVLLIMLIMALIAIFCFYNYNSSLILSDVSITFNYPLGRRITILLSEISDVAAESTARPLTNWQVNLTVGKNIKYKFEGIDQKTAEDIVTAIKSAGRRSVFKS